MKFKSDIEVQAGLRDSSGSTGASGQILSSNGNTVSWVPAGSSVASDVQNEVKAGVAINKGQAVYVTSADGTNIIVGLASNTTEATSSKTLGLLNATVAINGFADVVQIGRLAGLNTLAATVGDPVWLGSNGNLIYGLINKPYAPLHLVFIGIVTRVNANNGEIFVNVQNGFELNEIHDVDLKTNVPINGDILGYNGTLWVNKTIAGWLGYTPANQAITISTTAPLSGGGNLSANRTLSIAQANATTNGYLSSADWTTFNNKQSALTFTSPLVNTSGTVSITLATTSTNGYLSSADWNTFNSKQTALNGTGFVKASGTTISYDNSTYTPTSRTITINGVTQDLSANQTWTIASGVTSFNTRTGAVTLTSGDVTTALGYTPVTDARTITINGVTQDLTANRSWTVSAPETDTLATVTARGALSTGNMFTPVNGGLFFNGNGLYNTGVYGNGNDLWFNAGSTQKAALNSAGDFTANNSLRSPIFYDSNNTGYYLDPASQSNINNINISGQITQTGPGRTTTISPTNYDSKIGSSDLYLYTKSIDGGAYPVAMQIFRPSDAATLWPINLQPLGGGVNIGTYANYGYTLGIAGTGYSTNDFRAPIFYDSNNTGYYLDPSSTSNIVAMQVNGTLNVAASNAQFWTTTGGGYQRVDARDDSTGARMHWYGVLNNGATSNFRHAWYDGTAYFGITADSAFINFTRSGGGNITTDGSFRAPVFYDSNDTNYYVNPGDASRIRKTDIVAIGAGWLDALNIYSSDATNKWSLLPDAGASNSLRFAYNTSEKFRVQTNGSVISLVEHQSPIYYDFNNTGYYVDPASTSNFNAANFAGSVNLFGGYGPGSGPGLGFENQNSFIRLAFWGMDFYDWNHGIQMVIDNGYVSANNSFRAPIFYDSNNTGYYLDPNGASRINTINADTLVSYGISYASATGGFANSTYAVGVRNPIWRFGNADGYGLSYFQGSAGDASQDTIGFHFGTATSAGSQFKMRGDGVFFASNDIIAFSSSDRQLKDNITPIENALEKLKQIGGYTFDWNDKQEVHSGHDVGVIAQEVELVLPEVVTTRDTGYKAVKYEKIVPLLIEAIKEQQRQIEELKQLIKNK